MYYFMQNVDYQGEKFLDFIKKHKILDENTKIYRRQTIEEVANKLGVSRNQVYKYFGSKNLDDKVVSKILNVFNVDVHDIWPKNTVDEKIQLVKEIFKDSSPNEMLKAYEFLGERFIKNPQHSGSKSNKKQKDEITPVPYDHYMMVEYVDLSASAGPLGGSNVDLLPETKKRLVPKEFEKGNYLVVRVNGDSMVDGTDISIPDGAEILVKEYILEKGEKLPIRGNLFVICSREGNVFKQVVEHNTDMGYIRCRSYNKKYDDYNIPLDDVFQIFIYRKIVGYRPSIPEI